METKRRLTLYNERKEKIKEWAKAMYLNEEHAEIFAVGCLYADMTPSPLVIEELIDKAAEWLDNELPKYVMEGRESRPYISVALIDDFRKAMKGDDL